MEILVIYYSLHGHTAQMARHIARGVEEIDGPCLLSVLELTEKPVRFPKKVRPMRETKI